MLERLLNHSNEIIERMVLLKTDLSELNVAILIVTDTII